MRLGLGASSYYTDTTAEEFHREVSFRFRIRKEFECGAIWSGLIAEWSGIWGPIYAIYVYRNETTE